MKTMLFTAFAASSLVYCNSCEVVDTLKLGNSIYVEFDNDFKWRFTDKEIEINEHGQATVIDNDGHEVVIEFTNIEVVSMVSCGCTTGQRSGSTNPSNPDSEWLRDDCNRVMPAH